VANQFTPTKHEVSVAIQLASCTSVEDIAAALAQYREKLIRPLVGRSLDRQDAEDKGDKYELVMSRGDVFDVINRARGKGAL
jgi:hypothetical protein